MIAHPSPSVLLTSANAVLSVFWSLLAFVPLGVFCYVYMPHGLLYGFGFASLLIFIVPARVLAALQLSSRPRVFRRLGVHLVNRVAQDGSSIRRMAHGGQTRPLLWRNARARKALLSTSYFRERFHWSLLLFFLLSSVYAGIRRQAGWALLLTILNILYNLYPIWMQQYIRVRIGHWK